MVDRDRFYGLKRDIFLFYGYHFFVIFVFFLEKENGGKESFRRVQGEEVIYRERVLHIRRMDRRILLYK